MKNIEELPIQETRRRLEQRQKEQESWLHPMERANIWEWISKEGNIWLSIDNYCGEFYIEEHKTKQAAIKRLNQF